METIPHYILPEPPGVTVPISFTPFGTNIQYSGRSRSPMDANRMQSMYDGHSSFAPSSRAFNSPGRPQRATSPQPPKFTGYVDSSKEVSPFMPTPQRQDRSMSPAVNRTNGADHRSVSRQDRSMSPAITRRSGADTMYINGMGTMPFSGVSLGTTYVVSTLFYFSHRSHQVQHSNDTCAP